MPSTSDIDSFIESSSELLAAFPSTTLSITYSNQQKKNKLSNSEDKKKASNSVVFKCFEPNEGIVIKYKTHKTKELSRLLTFIGPRGVSVTKKKRALSDDSVKQERKAKKAKIEQITDQTSGLASIMCNTKFEITDKVTPATQSDNSNVHTKDQVNSDTIPNTGKASSLTTSSSKNKKKKKKGKK